MTVPQDWAMPPEPPRDDAGVPVSEAADESAALVEPVEPIVPLLPSTSDRLVDSLEHHGFFRGPISPAKHQRIQAVVQQFLEEEARKAREAGRPRPRRASRTLRIFTALLVTTSVFVWVARPFAPDDEPYEPPLVLQDASLRMAMVLQRTKVEDYRRTYGRLPDRMDSLDGMTYRRIAESEYEVHGVNGPVRLVLHSRQSSTEFLGTGLETLMRRRRRTP